MEFLKKQNMLIRLICLLQVGVVVLSLTPNKISETDNAMKYLSHYGYLADSANVDQRAGFFSTNESLVQAIREFQEFANLKITGELDQDTMSMIKTPRCGVKDKRSPSSMRKYSRFRRYIIQGSKWKKVNLSYRISKYPSDFSRSNTEEEIRRAFTEWSKITPLTFTQKIIGRADIDIRFESGNHDDDDPFDGPGGTLAHAYFPISGGDVHFDDEESWTINSRRGTNLFYVAVHEFGHALGLEHSKVRSAIMYPFYRGYNTNFEFDFDDINGIQSLYGPRETNSQEDIKPNTEGRTPDIPRPTDSDMSNSNDLCIDGKLDAIFNTADGSIYIFKGYSYWLLTKGGIAPGYPKLISNKWIGLPSGIDTAFSGPNERTYFFKGSKYWRYADNTVDQGYPKEISIGFEGIPNDLDAAMWINYLNKGFFFKGEKYWVFDAEEEPPVKSSYPKSIRNFEGIPNNLEDTLNIGGKVYFFKNGLYYKISNLALDYGMDNLLPPLPRSVRVLLKCFS